MRRGKQQRELARIRELEAQQWPLVNTNDLARARLEQLLMTRRRYDPSPFMIAKPKLPELENVVVTLGTDTVTLHYVPHGWELPNWDGVIHP